VPEAIGRYEEALRIKSEYAEAHYNLGGALVRIGKVPEAIGQYEQALRVEPDFAAAHNNLGAVLARLGKIQEAVGHYERVVQLRPESAEAHNNFGNVLSRVGRFQEATRQYEQALRLAPAYAEAENNLAWLLATVAPEEGGDPPRAVILAERACGLTGQRVAAHLDTLAVAYAAVGRFAEAIATAQKAVGLANSEGRADLAREIENRLELYRNNHVYRPPVRR
jgi:tetratricopeptide (TPR) repeat protein